MPYIMRLIEWSDGRPCPGAGHFIKTLDIQKAPMSGEWITVTADPTEARQWPTQIEAHRAYREKLRSYPDRPPPLTALNIQIEELSP